MQTLFVLGHPTAFFRRCQRRYGDVFRLDTHLFGREVCVVRPEAIKQVFTADPDVLPAGEANVMLEPLLGSRSVLLLDGREHLRQRRLLLPPFHGERMLTYASTMQRITERIVAEWPIGRPFRVHAEMQRLTLEVILRTVLGAADDDPETRELATAISDVLALSSSPISVLGTIPPLRRDLWGLSPWARFRRAVARVDERICAVIARRRRDDAPAGSRSDDVLTLLLSARDEDGAPMSDVELRDALMTLLVAGHETTATGLSWAFDCILHDARVLAKLEAELAERDGFEELPYLDATIKEVLRLRPVVAAVARRVRKPVVIDGFAVPEGAIVVPAICLTHMLPELYPEPERFEPERFLGKKPDPYAWLPFGGGIRRCIGMAFALFEMRVVLATVLRSVSLRAVEPRPARVTIRSFTHAPRGGVPVIVERRRARIAPLVRSTEQGRHRDGAVLPG